MSEHFTTEKAYRAQCVSRTSRDTQRFTACQVEALQIVVGAFELRKPIGSGQLDCSGNLLENIDISACPYLTELICTDNLILSEIPESFDRLTLFEHDIRYEYSVEKDAVTGQEKIVYMDRGKGWWYSGEPDKGYHGR